MERLYSAAEAQAALTEVEPLVKRLAMAGLAVADPARRLQLSRLTEANASSEAMAPLLAPAEEAARILVDLATRSIEVKDPLAGLIDFPAERDGVPIYLCWQLGEPAVRFWHDRDAGFAGRRPLDSD